MKKYETYHILNGDALAERLDFRNDQTIVMRECMISGPIVSENLEEFWMKRETYLSDTFNLEKGKYLNKSQEEISRIAQIPSGSTVYLWFEDDLFCQTNMWFCISLLNRLNNIKVFLVRPNHDDWGGFGYMNPKALQDCYKNPQVISAGDRDSFTLMWSYYCKGDYKRLKSEAKNVKTLIPRIFEVVNAEIERNRYEDQLGRPENSLNEIIKSGADTFSEAFKEFSKKEGIYGFGDSQVKTIYDKITRSK